MAELSRSLWFPSPGSLAVIARGTGYRSTDLGWELRVHIPGPDLRYNDAFAIIRADEVPAMIASLEQAKRVMEVLRTENFDGEYSRSFTLSDGGLSLHVTAQLGSTPAARFSADSGTSSLQTQPVHTPGGLDNLIESLKTVSNVGETLVASLARLEGQ